MHAERVSTEVRGEVVQTRDRHERKEEDDLGVDKTWREQSK